MQTEQYRDQAAILIAIANVESVTESILLTHRAEHLSLHSGEVAFPGGKWEPSDQNLMETALRESHEEVGLVPSRVDIIGQLPASCTRNKIKVTPYVGRVETEEGLTANVEELQSLFWVPLDFLVEDQRQRTDVFVLDGKEFWAPVYAWEGYKIWGFTARVIVDFLNRMYKQNITRQHSAPEVNFSAR